MGKNIYTLPRRAVAYHEMKEPQIEGALTFKVGDQFMIYEELQTGWARAEKIGTEMNKKQKEKQETRTRDTIVSAIIPIKIHNNKKKGEEQERERGFIPLTYVCYMKQIEEEELFLYQNSVERYQIIKVGEDTYVADNWELQHRNGGTICLNCNKILTNFETRYHADQIGQSWVGESVCEKCYMNMKKEALETKFALQYANKRKLIEMKRHPAEMHFMICAGSVAESMDNAFHAYWDRPCLGERQREGDEYQDYQYKTYGECYNIYTKLAKGLKYTIMKERIERKETINKRSFIGICGINQINWFMADWATIHLGAVGVPLPRAKLAQKDKSDIIHIINNAEVDCIFCEKKYTTKFIKLAEKCKSIRMIIQFENLTNDPKHHLKINTLIKGTPITVKDMGTILAKGEALPDIPALPIPHNELLTIIYTSGSTGKSKGAMLTDLNVRSTITADYWSYHPLQVMSYSPLSHVSDRLNVMTVILSGGTVGIFSGDMSRIWEDAQLIKPVTISSTPRLFNRLYKIYQEEKMIATKLKGNCNEEQLLEKVRALLGGRIKAITVGGAPTSQAVLKFLRKCFKCPVYNGYASTEAGSVFWLSESSHCDGKMKVFDHVDVKLRSVPELGYDAEGNPPRGEICIKSPTVINGYYRAPEKNKKAFDEEGYYCSGDVGERDKDGNITIIDRIKNIFKLAQGEYVTPEPLENIYIKSKYINQIFVYGESVRTFVVAVIVPNLAAIAAYFQAKGETLESLESHEQEIKELIMESMEKLGKEARVQEYEIPKGIIIERSPFTIQNNLLTGPSKLCRPALERKYRGDLKSLYQNLENVSDETLFVQLLCKHLKIDQNEMSQLSKKNFKELGGDSLKASTMNGLLSQLNIHISPDALMSDAFSVEELIQMVKEQSDAQNLIAQEYNSLELNCHEEAFNLSNIIQLPTWFQESFPAVLENTQNKITPLKEVEHILLTGITGFIGARLFLQLQESFQSLTINNMLNKNHKVKFHCLVRATNEEAANNRVLKQLQLLNINKLPDNIVCYPADLTKKNLGLDSGTYHYLADNIDRCYHIAAVVNSLYDLKACYWSNVVGTLTIAKMCGTGKKIAPLYFASSMSVKVFDDEEFYLKNYETSKAIDPLPETIEYFQSLGGYGQSKYISEKHLNIMREDYGLPITIFRIGLVGPDPVTGYGNINDWFTTFIKGSLQQNALPHQVKTHYFTMIPVSTACRLISDISMLDPDKQELASHYHIVHPHPVNGTISIKTLYQVLKTFGYNVRFLPFVDWYANINEQNPLWYTRRMYASGFPCMVADRFQTDTDSVEQTISNAYNVKFKYVSSESLFHVRPSGFPVQIVSSLAYIHRYLTFLISHRHLDPPETNNIQNTSSSRQSKDIKNPSPTAPEEKQVERSLIDNPIEYVTANIKEKKNALKDKYWFK